jgi:hypothetical protein
MYGDGQTHLLGEVDDETFCEQSTSHVTTVDGIEDATCTECIGWYFMMHPEPYSELEPRPYGHL